MTRRFIGLVIGAALAVTAIGNAPARADENIARALAAIVGVAIIGKVISDRLDDDDNTVTRRANDNRYDFVQPPARIVGNGARRAEPHALPRRADRRLLPGECLRSFSTRDRPYRVFTKKCLERSYGFTRSLPRACEVKFKADKTQRRGYDARCLRREGYQLARR